MHPVSSMFVALKASAKARGIPFKIEKEDFHIWAQEVGVEKLKKLKKSVTVDRVDSDLGYEIGNIQVLTNLENAYKSNYVATKLGRTKVVNEPF